MRVVLQRVTRAEVRVDGAVVGAIEGGFLALAGVAKDDEPSDAEWIAAKIAGLRVFPDEARKMNRSIVEAGGSVLLVSQFTLHADAAKGRRPSFEKAARPELAVPLLDHLARAIQAAGVKLATGRFGATMEVELVNDGPVTILLDSEDGRRRGEGDTERVSFRRRLHLAGFESPFLEEPLVLASASERRRDLLLDLGIPFIVESADVDESAHVPSDPHELVRTLAERKARAVADRRERGIVLGADTVVVREGRIYGKPADAEEAERMLRELAGRTHLVYTGICVVDAASGVARGDVVVTSVRFHAATDGEIRRYVETREPFGKAGAYAIQGHGALLVASIDGDYSNVVGLPVGATLDVLATFFAEEEGGARGEASVPRAAS